MIALESKLTNTELDYAELKDRLEPFEFTLGGNWDYSQGCFDRRLDGEKQTVWLRIPFDVVHGRLDADAPPPDLRVRVGEPYVLRHLPNFADDHDAQFYTYGALVNQFQAPVDPDADVDASYAAKAKALLREIEVAFG